MASNMASVFAGDSTEDSGETQLTWSIPTDQQYMKTYYQLTFPQCNAFKNRS